MTRLLPLLAILALFLGLPSGAHTQSTTPTVSTVAITSSPGTDNTYATADIITVGLTFSEAVTATGTPRITLNIGGHGAHRRLLGSENSHRSTAL